MTAGGLVVEGLKQPPRVSGGRGVPLRIICPTYWYPQHASDTQATYVHDINRHLVRRGHSVTVVTPGHRSLPRADMFDGVKIVRFPLELPPDLTYGRVAQSRVSWLGRFARVVVMAHYMEAQHRADVVHAHWAIPTGPAAVIAAKKLQVPSVITMHGGDVYVNPEQGYDFPTRWYVRPALRWTLRHAGALTAITEDCRQHALRAGAPAEHIRLVFNGTDLRRFSPADNGAQRDSRFGPHMIFACRQLFPRKGIRFLLEAAAELKPQFPDLKIVLAGDGFERPELARLATELGIAEDVTFLGWVPNADLPPYYRAAAVSVIPSLEEGLGIPRGDSKALAQAIEALLADPQRRRQMGQAGRERALRLFDWDRTAEQFEEIYREVASRMPR